jgi:hypothetical protein
MGDAELGGDQARSPARPPALLADAIVVGLAPHRRAAARTRGARLGPGARAPLGLCGLSVAVDPVLDRGGRDPTLGRGLASGHPLLKALVDQLCSLPTGQPPTLALHPGSPSVSSSTHSLGSDPDAYSVVRKVPGHVS